MEFEILLLEQKEARPVSVDPEGDARVGRFTASLIDGSWSSGLVDHRMNLPGAIILHFFFNLLRIQDSLLVILIKNLLRISNDLLSIRDLSLADIDTTTGPVGDKTILPHIPQRSALHARLLIADLYPRINGPLILILVHKQPIRITVTSNWTRQHCLLVAVIARIDGKLRHRGGGSGFLRRHSGRRCLDWTTAFALHVEGFGVLDAHATDDFGLDLVVIGIDEFGVALLAGAERLDLEAVGSCFFLRAFGFDLHGVEGIAVALEALGVEVGAAIFGNAGGDERPFVGVELGFDSGFGGEEELGL